MQEKGKFFTDLRIGAERRESPEETGSFVRGKSGFPLGKVQKAEMG